MGNGKFAMIVQMGAVYFDRYSGELGQTFKVNVDAVDVEKHGGQMDADTVMWWLSQSKAAQESILAEPRLSFQDAMRSFYNFAKSADCIWSHATFDFPIVQESFKMLHYKYLRYKAARDIRTLSDLSGMDHKQVPREGTHHDALDDAIHQVKYCVPMFNAIRGRQQ